MSSMKHKWGEGWMSAEPVHMVGDVSYRSNKLDQTKSQTLNSLQYNLYGDVICYAKQLLGTDQVDVVWCDSMDPLHHFMATHSKYIRAKVISQHGLQPDLHQIRGSGRRSVVQNTQGISIYQNPYLSDLQYAVAELSHPKYENIAIVPEGNLYRLSRANLMIMRNNRLISAAESSEQLPTLNGTLLQDIEAQTLQMWKRRKQIRREFGTGLRVGVLLYGPPGNGKTTLLNHITSQFGIQNNKHNVERVSNSKIEACYQKNKLGEIFNREGLTIFDDIDPTFLTRRNDGKVACSILSEMDGIDRNVDCIRIFATNESIDDLDPAFMRPRRIDRVFHIGPPDLQSRQIIIQKWSPRLLGAIKMDVQDIAQETKDFSGAEIEGIRQQLIQQLIVNERCDYDAAVRTVRTDRPKNLKVGFNR